MSTVSERGEQACRGHQRQVAVSQWPVSCPLKEERVWDAHPRVFLMPDAEGSATCPYCGTVYHPE